MIKLLLHKSKRRVGSPGVFITPGTYFILYQLEECNTNPPKVIGSSNVVITIYSENFD